MTVHDTPEQQRERKNRQARHRREMTRAARKTRVQTDSVALDDEVEVTVKGENEVEGVVEPTTPTRPTDFDPDRELYWQSYAKVRKTRDLSQLAHDLELGVASVHDHELATVAVALTRHFRAAGITRASWPPCPTRDQLAERDDWLAERLAAAQDEQEAAIRQRQSLARLRKAGLSSAPAGRANPMDQQHLGCSLDEFADRLARTVKTHQSARGAFDRVFLDHSSRHYIDKEEGGVSNKMVRLAANEIAGRKQREFDESWKVVCIWMRERGVEIETD